MAEPQQQHETRDTDTIVVGVDGSPASIAALRWAIDEASATNASVRAVMSWRPDVLTAPPAPPAAPLAELRQEQHDELHRAVAAARGSRQDVNVAAELVEGITSDQLTKAARHARMLVVGSRGYGRIHDALLGSVSMECVHRAKCPVVVIPRRMIGHAPQTVPARSVPTQR